MCGKTMKMNNHIDCPFLECLCSLILFLNVCSVEIFLLSGFSSLMSCSSLLPCTQHKILIDSQAIGRHCLLYELHLNLKRREIISVFTCAWVVDMFKIYK